ncbi:hypothetical protein BDP55DRAFT_628224 [Colletotrichum godetiae]|uniref:Uncharacterized protein n=1 Tax=Colletotrichum godetiae TaxID=1209918 RepID=A0AAJ0AUF9_9PEZI|nr:uncharacterized protein BDP55DRAFT_628224 [Colletotrichum godetiae]KAK1690569.1 hypothetical protein BDP55DRAFT_628224 [Colletotrichum godetiae]
MDLTRDPKSALVNLMMIRFRETLGAVEPHKSDSSLVAPIQLACGLRCSTYATCLGKYNVGRLSNHLQMYLRQPASSRACASAAQATEWWETPCDFTMPSLSSLSYLAIRLNDKVAPFRMTRENNLLLNLIDIDARTPELNSVLGPNVYGTHLACPKPPTSEARCLDVMGLITGSRSTMPIWERQASKPYAPDNLTADQHSRPAAPSSYLSLTNNS